MKKTNQKYQKRIVMDWDKFLKIYQDNHTMLSATDAYMLAENEHVRIYNYRRHKTYKGFQSTLGRHIKEMKINEKLTNIITPTK